MPAENTFDIIVIGAGHNGLSLGLYLAHAGLKVLVLERRAEFGGGLCTEESTLPGFYHNLHSNFHGSLPFLPAYHDFDLQKRGVHYFHPEANIGMPLRDGRCLILYKDEFKNYDSIAKFSEKDALTFQTLRLTIAQHVNEFLGIAYSPPPPDDRARDKMQKYFRDWFGQNVIEQSPLEFVLERFENKHFQALLLYHMAIGGFDIRLKELAPLGIGFLGFTTNWQLCRGGSHQLAHALGGEFISKGGELLEHAHVSKIVVEDGTAKGVVTSNGTKFYANKAVVSSVDLNQTFLQMMDKSNLSVDFSEQVKNFQYGPSDVLFGAHLALREAPRYTSAKFNPDMDSVFNINIGYETPEDLLEHYAELDEKKVPAQPRLNCGVNTLFDPSQAPEGHHTGLIWQFAPYDIEGKGPQVWDEIKEGYAIKCVEAWSEYAPNLTPDTVLAIYAYTPYDIGRKMVNMRGGGFHFGAVIPAQAAGNRPLPSLSQYRTPVNNLYLCGSCMHAHGGIIGSPSYNCLQIMAEDLGILDKVPVGNKFWEPEREKWRKELYNEPLGTGQ